MTADDNRPVIGARRKLAFEPVYVMDRMVNGYTNSYCRYRDGHHIQRNPQPPHQPEDHPRGKDVGNNPQKR